VDKRRVFLSFTEDVVEIEVIEDDFEKQILKNSLEEYQLSEYSIWQNKTLDDFKKGFEVSSEFFLNCLMIRIFKINFCSRNRSAPKINDSIELCFILDRLYYRCVQNFVDCNNSSIILENNQHSIIVLYGYAFLDKGEDFFRVHQIQCSVVPQINDEWTMIHLPNPIEIVCPSGRKVIFQSSKEIIQLKKMKLQALGDYLTV
jgi:hypothetical protein